MSVFLDLFYKTVGLILQAWKLLDLELKLYLYFIQEGKKKKLPFSLDSQAVQFY